jgi:hypothetical protein
MWPVFSRQPKIWSWYPDHFQYYSMRDLTFAELLKSSKGRFCLGDGCAYFPDGNYAHVSWLVDSAAGTLVVPTVWPNFPARYEGWTFRLAPVVDLLGVHNLPVSSCDWEAMSPSDWFDRRLTAGAISRDQVDEFLRAHEWDGSPSCRVEALKERASK